MNGANKPNRFKKMKRLGHAKGRFKQCWPLKSFWPRETVVCPLIVRGEGCSRLDYGRRMGDPFNRTH
jgi:hypothetical protein